MFINRPERYYETLLPNNNIFLKGIQYEVHVIFKAQYLHKCDISKNFKILSHNFSYNIHKAQLAYMISIL